MARTRSARVTLTRLLGAQRLAAAAVTLAACSAADDQSNAFSDSGVVQSSTGGSSFGGANMGGTQQGVGGNQTGAGSVSVGGVSSSGGSVNGGSSGATGNGGSFGNGGASTGGAGTGGTAACTDAPPPNGDTCEHAVLYNWCGAPWMNGTCARSCGACSGGGSTGGAQNTGGAQSTGGSRSTGGTQNTGGAQSTGGSLGAGGLPPIQGGQNGWASRYWDCCKPACGWPGSGPGGSAMRSCGVDNKPLSDYNAPNVCIQHGPAYMCWSGAPWEKNGSLSYGFAAASGGNFACGRCYQVQFTGSGHSGNNAGATSLNGKQMIIQIINNGGVGGDQLDLLIPGGGVGDFDGCSKQWETSDLGQQYGGFLAGCNGSKSCVQQKCNTIFANKPELLAGCNWFLGWFNAADNPNLVFKQTTCPSEITQRSGLSDPG